MNDTGYPTAPVVIVDDEPQILFSFSVSLKSAGITNVVTLEDGRKLMPLLSAREASAVLLDLSMPHLPGTALLREVNASFPQIPVIIVTANHDLDTAVACMKAGAFDYLVKPVEMERLLGTVKNALQMTSLQGEISSLKHYLLTNELTNEKAFSAIITRNPRMRAIFQYAEAVAPSLHPVLITGETGVGKELMARAIHELSGRTGAFVEVNIAGLDDSLFSDTLFGHRKGAFTGADQPREGLVAQAAGGTVFLDEIGDLNEAAQIKLLRLLQERKYLPLGSDTPRNCTARVIVATNRDLPSLIQQGKFRRDLYYRLRTHQIDITPLRRRREDIHLLLNHFMDAAAVSLGKRRPSYPPELITLLATYHFPGNVRELESMVHDAVARHQGGVLSLESFKEIISRENTDAASAGSSDHWSPELLSGITGRFPTLSEAEDYLTFEALRLAGNNQGIAASLLGITRQALNKRLNRSKG